MKKIIIRISIVLTAVLLIIGISVGMMAFYSDVSIIDINVSENLFGDILLKIKYSNISGYKIEDKGYDDSSQKYIYQITFLDAYDGCSEKIHKKVSDRVIDDTRDGIVIAFVEADVESVAIGIFSDHPLDISKDGLVKTNCIPGTVKLKFRDKE